MFSPKFGQVGCKSQKRLSSNKYCDLFVYASFTKFTGPAMLFLNNRIIYKKNILWVLSFLWWWSLQIGQLNKSPCRCKKKVTKSEKLTNSIKLELHICPQIPLIIIQRYTRSIIFVTFCQKIEHFLNLFVN